MFYHFASKRYAALRPIALQRDKQKRINELLQNGATPEGLESYIHEVYFFLGTPTVAQIKRMQRAGFWRWNMNQMYIYTVDPSRIKGVTSVRITSTPQQRDYDNLHWDVFIKSGQSRRMYFDARDKYLLETYGIKPEMTIKEFVDHPLLSDWSDFDKHFEYNLAHGYKDQYASYIPHVAVSVTLPIAPKAINKVTIT